MNRVILFVLLVTTSLGLVAGCTRHEKTVQQITPKMAAPTTRDIHLGTGSWMVDWPDGWTPGGPELMDLAGYIQSKGIDYLIVKAFDGDRRWTSWDPIVGGDMWSSSPMIYPYGRLRGKAPAKELQLACELLRSPAPGIVLDIEGEFNNKATVLEAILKPLKELRDTRYPNKLIMASTFAYRSVHRPTPFSVMEKYCDAIMPQCYFTSFHERPWTTMTRVWREWQQCPVPVIPTCQSYGPNHKLVVVDPREIADFMVLGDKGYGVNFFKDEATEKRQWDAIEGKIKSRLTASQIHTAQNPPKQKAIVKPDVKVAPARGNAKKFAIPAMPLAPIKSGSLSGLMVIIDPGHGNADPGACWSAAGSDFTESGVTYQTAWQLAKLVREKGGWVYLTVFSPEMMVAPSNAQTPPERPWSANNLGTGTRFVTGHNRPRALYTSAIYKKFKVEGKKLGWRQMAFVSLHVDAQKPGITGAHTLYYKHPFLAQKIAAEFKKAKIVWNAEGDARAQEVTVLTRNPEALKYETLVEMGVPKNSKRDSWRLRSPKHRMRIIKAIIKGLESILT